MSERTPEPAEDSQRERFFRNFNEWFEAEMGRRSVAAVPGPAPSPTAIPGLAADYDELDDKTKKAIDKLMEKMKPDIEKKAVDLLTFEIRDKIARTGDINKIIKMMKKGKKVKLKRKKGCIYLQVGTGDPNDRIEEILIANTGG